MKVRKTSKFWFQREHRLPSPARAAGFAGCFLKEISLGKKSFLLALKGESLGAFDPI